MWVSSSPRQPFLELIFNKEMLNLDLKSLIYSRDEIPLEIPIMFKSNQFFLKVFISVV